MADYVVEATIVKTIYVVNAEGPEEAIEYAGNATRIGGAVDISVRQVDPKHAESERRHADYVSEEG